MCFLLCVGGNVSEKHIYILQVVFLVRMAYCSMHSKCANFSLIFWLQAFQPTMQRVHDVRRLHAQRGPYLAIRPVKGLRSFALYGSKLDQDDEPEKIVQKDPQKNEPAGLAERISGAFKETEKGKGSPFDQTMSYLVDLFTVTAGAGVFMCLVFNFMGIVPCIDW